MKKRYSYIIILLILPLFFMVNLKVIANTKEPIESELNSLVSSFYQAIIDQNYGVAEKIYAIPPLGKESNVPDLEKINSPGDYLEYLYPTTGINISSYEILEIKHLEGTFYEAFIQLKGGTKPNFIAFTQRLLVHQDKNSNWKLSLEKYLSYQLLNVESKPIKDLTDIEKVYRFYLELNNKNYGNAAKLIDPDMTGLKDSSQEAIIEYLKDFQRKEVITSENLYITNQFASGDDMVIVISGTPTRTIESDEITSLFVKQKNGQSYLNTNVGLEKLEGSIVQFKEVTTSATLITLGLLALILFSYYISGLITRWTENSTGVRGPTYLNENIQGRDLTRGNTHNTNVDIEKSVDNILESFSAETESTKGNKEAIEIDTTSKRVIHSEDTVVKLTKTKSNSVGRKIHID